MEKVDVLCATQVIKVILVFSNPLMQGGIKSLLKEQADFEVVATANRSTDILNELADMKADIILGDDSASFGGDLDHLLLVRNKCPNAKVIIMGDLHQSRNFDEFAKIAGAGIRAVLPNSTDTSQLLDYLRMIARNDIVVYASDHSGPFGTTQTRDRTQHQALTKRELEVLRLVAQGCANKEIAVRCSVSESTVKAYLRLLLEKLQANNRAQAVAIAHEMSILD